jgi:hypothetical protein
MDIEELRLEGVYWINPADRASEGPLLAMQWNSDFINCREYIDYFRTYEL